MNKLNENEAKAGTNEQFHNPLAEANGLWNCSFAPALASFSFILFIFKVSQ
jgi:hypothetical protein